MRAPESSHVMEVAGEDELQKPIVELVRDLKGLTERLSRGLRPGRRDLSPLRAGTAPAVTAGPGTTASPGNTSAWR